MRSCAISHTLIYNVSDVDSRVLSTQLANQGVLLLQRVSHGDCSENLRRYIVPKLASYRLLSSWLLVMSRGKLSF